MLSNGPECSLLSVCLSVTVRLAVILLKCPPSDTISVLKSIKHDHNSKVVLLMLIIISLGGVD